MTNPVFGIDFGTTNSLASVIIGERALTMVDQITGRPHPSVIWYRGDDIIVGKDALDNMDLTASGAPAGFIRSPKMSLRRAGPMFIDGRTVDVSDAVAQVFRHIRNDASEARERAQGYSLEKAVLTIPIDFGGPERRALRQAANKAGIGVVQFVHEPVAALYAYIRSKPNVQRELARLEGRTVLVFDWGGGTLDLTLCKIEGGAIMQIASLGDNDVGGDKFDERLRNFLRDKHANAYGIDDISALEQAGMSAKLLRQCEIVKISLSDSEADSEHVIIRNYLKAEGPAQNLATTVTRADLDMQSASIVRRGLARIEELLERTGLSHQDIELCLATGGMINMPTIRNGLTERFLGRVPKLENGDRIIAEGAAWIASDGLRLTLSKGLEILVADTTGTGTYYPLVSAGWELPLENETQNVTNTRLFCTDPREGIAVVEIAKPVGLGRPFPSDARHSVCVAEVQVDQEAKPLLERIECHLQIDHDYVAQLTLRSTGRGHETVAEFHDLDFGLRVMDGNPIDGPENQSGKIQDGGTSRIIFPANTSNLTQKSNIAIDVENNASKITPWRLVPGDLVDLWHPTYFDTRAANATKWQNEERNFYVPCATCKRRISQIKAEGRAPMCTDRCGF